MSLKSNLRKAVPKSLLDNYHYAESVRFAQKFDKPSEKMVVVGIVGSKGKTTTANMIWSVLSAMGDKVGQIGTANIRISEKEELNKYHMTMPGARALQGILAEMVKAGCKYVVLEVPSEGQTQWRHIGINFDILVFTNVEREIMAAHRDSMEILHKHNKRVFAAMAKAKHKTIGGKLIEKTIIANADSNDSLEYMKFDVDNKLTYGVEAKADLKATDISSNKYGVDFKVEDEKFHTNILGSINAMNALAAVAVGKVVGMDTSLIKKGLDSLEVIPGRMEVINEGQNFTVVVDYAHTKASMSALMESARAMIGGGKIITLLGAEGGGRDVEKRPVLGEIVGKYSDYVVVCNVDPYEDEPMKIIEDVAKGAIKAGMQEGKDLFSIEDRREGILKALSLAKKGDLVLITGKGAEQSIIIDGKSSPWDDRKVVREELKKLLKA